MLVEIIVLVLIVGAAVLVYKNNQKKADAVVAKAQDAFNDTKNSVKKEVRTIIDDVRKDANK